MRQRSPHRSAGPEAIRDRIEPGLEGRLQHLLHRRLYDPVFHGGNAQRPKGLEVTGFGDEHSAHRTRVKLPAPKFIANRDEKTLCPVTDDFAHRDPIYPRCTGTAIALYA